MGLLDEPLANIKKNLLLDWDFSGAFPTTGYTFDKGVLVVDGWPWQLIRQMEAKTNQQMTKPIISIVSMEPSETTRSFSDIDKTGVGAGPLQWRLGRRASPSFLISIWVDQQLGGMDMARKLGSEVHAAVFYNRNRLSTIRHLRMIHSHESKEDSAQLFRFDLVIEGDVYFTLDV